MPQCGTYNTDIEIQYKVRTGSNLYLFCNRQNEARDSKMEGKVEIVGEDRINKHDVATRPKGKVKGKQKDQERLL